MTKISNQYSLTNVLFADAVNGRVGIGNTTSPSRLLEVASGGDLGYIRVSGNRGNADGVHVGSIEFYNSNSSILVGEVKGITGTGGTQSASGQLAFYTNNAGTYAERMRITSAGNVGIGTSSPFNTNGYTSFTINGTTGSIIEMLANGTRAMQIVAASDISYFYVPLNTPMAWYTNATERMRITSGGNVGIGTTTPAVRLQIDGTNDQERFRLQNTDSPSYMAFSEQNITMWRPNDSGSAFIIRTQAISGTWTGGGGGIEFRPLNTLRMTIGPTGNIGAPSGTNIYNASDARLKQNISQITYGLDAIAALNPVKFNWVDGFEPSEDGKDMLGFVAQEVQQVLPEAVELFGNDIVLNGETVTTPLRVNEKFIIPVLVKAIQELSAQTSEQQLQINELKALLNA